MKEEAEFHWCAERLKALADPARLRLITSLLAGSKTVGVLSEELRLELVRVSHHLGILRNCGIVVAKKQGRYVAYTLHPDVFVVENRSDTEHYLDLGCCRLEMPADD